MDFPISQIPAEVKQAKQSLGIVGSAPALMEAIQRALRVAPIDLSVLVTGESGTGKEFFPKIIHRNSPRKHATYIAVNCGAIPEGTIDSELFGHEKGSFTGAVATRKGYFEEANGGTIFLDEVAELPLTTQARLLRVLETGEYMRVGSSQVMKSNVRIVAATNVDMEKAVAEGRFREDLYYRLSTVGIYVPPLRDRGNDIIMLAEKFAEDFAEKYHTPRISLSEAADQLLRQYRWPGNVRQLKNVVEQLALFKAGKNISQSDVSPYLTGLNSTPVCSEGSGAHHSYDAEREALFSMIMSLRHEITDLKAKVQHLRETPDTPPAPSPVKALVPYKSPETQQDGWQTVPTLEDTERETIRKALERNDGRRKATAVELNISERTLYRKIREYGLE